MNFVEFIFRKLKYTTFGEIKIFEQAFLLDLCGKDLTDQEPLESANIHQRHSENLQPKLSDFLRRYVLRS
ncbi:MAG: hypothetical protein DRH21_03115 [Deltaproteobacteria bacterium]|nr:MAG: hypothetical protein DRH21_03115 [Deltaproteobacteria bacterium]